ncbi:MAG: aconitate hydratase, partial [Verrucomicrobia bacterium]|nr:aconitate hydratase [Verrucomicrobiota bacterium]
TGALKEGVTATDLVLTITQMLRKAKVVGKFVEFFGHGAASLSVTDRATIANMAPEYGATMGFFPVDEECVKYLRATGRSEELCRAYENYHRAQGLWGIPQKGAVDYSQSLELELGSIIPSVAGPKRPQDRIELNKLKSEFRGALTKPLTENGFGLDANDLYTSVRVTSAEHGHEVDHSYGHRKDSVSPSESEMRDQHPTPDVPQELPLSAFARFNTEIGHGSVLIAAITSCTNTSNPSVMLAAGLLAKKAVQRGLKVNPVVKTSLAPGSRVVTDYLETTGLQDYLDKLGFNLVGYGCTTCIGNSGPLAAPVEAAIVDNDLVAASVLSGNRNFEARVHHDSVTTDHISPAGSIKKTSPAGKYLIENGVNVVDFNSYGSRRGNDRVMTRGTFANVRIKNLMVPGTEGGVTKLQPGGEVVAIYDAAVKYAETKTPLVILAGQEYGTGSSRDWAAKGTNLLGVRAVVAQSFERIHRSNLVGMGVLPLQFKEGTTAQTLKLDGTETYDIVGLDVNIKPQQDLTLKITRKDGSVENVNVRCRIDTPIEIDYYQHGGILPFVLRQLVANA